jgi:hypothetical protein
MRLSITRLAAPAAILAALAIAVPANSIAQPVADDGASAAQKGGKDPRDRGDKGGSSNPQCRGVERRIEITAFNLKDDQAKLKAAKAKLKTAKAALKATTPGTKANKKAKAKVAKAKKRVKSRKAEVKRTKSDLRSAKSQAKARGC